MLQLEVDLSVEEGFLVSKEVVVDAEWSEELDSYLLRSVGVKSTAVIAQELGMGPLDVRKRVNELLEDIDVLTVHQERTRLLIELRSLVNRATERLDAIGTGLSDREFAQVLNSTSQTIRVHLQELDKMESKDDEALQELNRRRVAELLKLMDRVVLTSVQEIAGTHDLDESDLLEVFSSRLVEVAAEMDLEGTL